MTFNDNHQYLIKTDIGYKLFYLDDNTLYSSIFSNEIKSDEKVIDSNINCFGADTDIDGTIHIICIDSQGRLILLINNLGEWKKTIICNLDIKSYHYKNLKIYVSYSFINIFFMMSNKESDRKWRIMHYSLDSNKYKSYKIGEIVTDKYFSSFKTDVDKEGNIHLVYKSIINNKSVLFYKMYNNKHDIWSLTAKLSNKNFDTINFGILCDVNGFINVIWSYINDKNIEVNYLKKKINSTITSGWLKSKTLPKVLSYFSSPILIQYNDNLKLIWKHVDKFFFTETKVSKDAWSSIEKIKESHLHKLYSISYIGNKYKNHKYVKIPFTYGNCNNEIFLVGLNEIDEEMDVLTLLFNENSIESNRSDSFDISKIKSRKIILNDYIKSIKSQFYKTDIIFDLFSYEDNVWEDQLFDYDDLTKSISEIFFELSSLKTEISNLKEKEIRIKKSINELSSNNSDF